ncbi:unnamed protein product, partial [Bubo scandiacus]
CWSSRQLHLASGARASSGGALASCRGARQLPLFPSTSSRGTARGCPGPPHLQRNGTLPQWRSEASRPAPARRPAGSRHPAPAPPLPSALTRRQQSRPSSRHIAAAAPGRHCACALRGAGAHRSWRSRGQPAGNRTNPPQNRPSRCAAGPRRYPNSSSTSSHSSSPGAAAAHVQWVEGGASVSGQRSQDCACAVGGGRSQEPRIRSGRGAEQAMLWAELVATHGRGAEPAGAEPGVAHAQWVGRSQRGRGGGARSRACTVGGGEANEGGGRSQEPRMRSGRGVEPAMLWAELVATHGRGAEPAGAEPGAAHAQWVGRSQRGRGRSQEPRMRSGRGRSQRG